MILKMLPVTALLLLSACSSWNTGKTQARSSAEKSAVPAQTYASERNQLVSVKSIASANNKCVDNFNFLRQASSDRYHKYSQDYIRIGDEYKFLNVNKNIMGSDAKDVFALKLDMKLDALCNKVDYTGYQIIKKKMQNLQDI